MLQTTLLTSFVSLALPTIRMHICRLWFAIELHSHGHDGYFVRFLCLDYVNTDFVKDKM